MLCHECCVILSGGEGRNCALCVYIAHTLVSCKIVQLREGCLVSRKTTFYHRKHLQCHMALLLILYSYFFIVGYSRRHKPPLFRLQRSAVIGVLRLPPLSASPRHNNIPSRSPPPPSRNRPRPLSRYPRRPSCNAPSSQEQSLLRRPTSICRYTLLRFP